MHKKSEEIKGKMKGQQEEKRRLEKDGRKAVS